MQLTVRAPASSANLGPGFDCLGLAVDIWTTVRVETVSGRKQVDGPARLVEQGVNAAYEGVGKPPALSIEWDGGIPLARGLGASAALRAAGLLAGNALLDGPHDADALLALGSRLEGHPDNMAPALLGGLQVVVQTQAGLLHLPGLLPADLGIVVFVPDFEMPTQESRRRLPRQFGREDLIFNASRVAMLLTALATGDYDLLNEATQDRVHQPVRAEIFPGLTPIMAAARQAGASASYLSGGGSTVAAFVNQDGASVAQAMTAAAAEHGFSGRSIVSRPSAQGAHLLG